MIAPVYGYHPSGMLAWQADQAWSGPTITAPGAGSAQAVTSQTWTLDGKVATRTDAGGNLWTNQYNNACCGQFVGQIDPLGHGSLSNQDGPGRTVHTATVSEFTTAVSGANGALDPADAMTLGESTTRYDNLGRPVARTQWLLALGQIDKANPPIAGLGGIASARGITTQTYYDTNLSDRNGLDDGTGMEIQKLGGGTYQLSLKGLLDQLKNSEASGWAEITFGRGAPGSAVVQIGPDETISVSVSDGLGRTVFAGQLQKWNGPNPFAVVSHSCQRYDFTAHVNGFGTVVESRTVDPNGKTTRSRADASGRVLESLDQENRVTTTSYDPAGNVLSVRDPNGVGYDAVYDPLGRMTSQTDTWGDTVSMTYDREGNVLTQTDAKGKVTTMVYDARNRRKTVTDRLAGVTTFNYHPAGHLASIVDAEGQMTAYEHNARGEKIKETYPDHVNGSAVGTPGYGIVQFDYDPAGRLLRKTDQVGDTVYFNYDMAGRVPQRDYRTAANSPNGPIADSDTFQFDMAGRMTSATSGRYTNAVGMTYDHAGRLSTESLSIAGQTYTVTREYDALNRIKKYIYPDGTQVERTYTDRGQLAMIKYNGSVIDTRTYDLGGRLSTSTYSNGAVTTRTYRSSGSQKDNLLASIATTNPGPNKVGTYSYTWDANKNKTAETITNSPLSTHGFSTGATGYDDENRVTNWARSDSSHTQTWSLSPVGDWNAFNQTGAAPLTQTRTHGPTHEFNSFTGTTSGTLTYDVKGNLTSRPATLAAPALNLSWDMDNRLIGADTNGSSGSLEVYFQYDAFGKRVARSESGSTVIYFQAGQQTILDYTSGAAPNSPTYRYVYGDYIDEPVMRETASGSEKHFYHRNQQYSITALTDSAGDTAERYAYTAYGQLSVFDSSGSPLTSSSLNSRITYTGREWDAVIAQYYFRARWLDPTTGRFSTRDPLGIQQGLSLYRSYFCLRDLDPTGLTSISRIGHRVPGIRFGKVCAVVMQNHSTESLPPSENFGGLSIGGDKFCPQWEDEAYEAVADRNGDDILNLHGEHSDSVFRSILEFVKSRKCCTVYFLGHQGGNIEGDPNIGGAVTYPDPKDPWVHQKIFPNQSFEAQLRAAIKENKCALCAINLWTCGFEKGSEEYVEQEKNRQEIADRTGCYVCGSEQTIRWTEHTLGPTGVNPNTGTLWNNKRPWPNKCKTPASGKSIDPMWDWVNTFSTTTFFHF